MSPNEFQLRAALREGEGEGEGVNAALVIANAREVRRRRRRLTGSIAGGVAIAALVGAGSYGLSQANLSGTQYAGSGGGVHSATSTKAQRGATGGKQPVGAPVRPNASRQYVSPNVGAQGSGSQAAGQCPAEPAALSAPSPGAPGSAGPLFAKPVAHVTVCAYGAESRSSAYQSRLSMAFSGSSATALTGSLERSPTTPGPSSCAASVRTGRLEVIAIATDGSPLDPVVVQLGCRTEATNGTAVRYRWNPPASVLRLFGGTAPVPLDTAPPGRVNGSPPRR